MVMGDRILIIGMNNPLSMDPRYALYPAPVGCTGYNLWKMVAARTGASRTDYLRSFQRTNLVIGAWSERLARENWETMGPDVVANYDVVVLLGAAVRRVCSEGLPLPELGLRGNIATLPHPSGLNRAYNNPITRAAAEILLEELYVRANDC